ncbi:hypothetical protein BLNAU_23 [Blattamonas nauphoetae]|uniref:WD repeat-containing protein n=1 Tax=Blattamonas nauphoetae TaxID=2049346 RepID=A0ABQ9YLT6_9EUKA|nr:hypothetical protein BLNAU_23 [Blattamonas nauphoetae]
MIWSLKDSCIFELKYRKDVDKSIQFSDDGFLMFYLNRRNSQDFIDIFSLIDWKPVTSFQLHTRDAAGFTINHSPSEVGHSFFCVWDSPAEKSFYTYSLSGALVQSFNMEPLAVPQAITQVPNLSLTLGIRGVQFSPNPKQPLLAVGSFDEHVRLFTLHPFTTIDMFEHLPVFPLRLTDDPAIPTCITPETNIYIHTSPNHTNTIIHIRPRLTLSSQSSSLQSTLSSISTPVRRTRTESLPASRYHIIPTHPPTEIGESINTADALYLSREPGPSKQRQSFSSATALFHQLSPMIKTATTHKLPTGKEHDTQQLSTKLSDPRPHTGTKLMGWSHDGIFLATVSSSCPHCVWIWNVAKLILDSIIILHSPIKRIKWHPQRQILSIIIPTSSSFIVWTAESCSIQHDQNESISSLKWLQINDENFHDGVARFPFVLFHGSTYSLHQVTHL